MNKNKISQKLLDKVKILKNNEKGTIFVYSNDFLSTKKFLLIKDRIITFLPKFSIIGSFFSNDSIIKIIESYQIGILEHDLFSWKVEGTEFVFSDELNKTAKNLLKQINESLNNLSKDKKRKIVNLIYDLLLMFKVENLDDLFSKKIDIPSLLKKYNLGVENIDILLKILNLVFQL